MKIAYFLFEEPVEMKGRDSWADYVDYKVEGT